MKNDDGTRIQRIKDTDRGNGDNDGEYWKVTTTAGVQYFFGYNRLPNWTTGKPETKSTWTVPVYGDDTGEPCHASTFAASWCQQAWRWNLDLVLDPHGDDITYWYTQETNSYGRNLKAADDTPYVRGGYLSRIDYGQRKADIYSASVKPAAQVVFGNSERCLPQTGVSCAESAIDSQKFYWYDTPWDLNCKAGTDCDQGRLSPTFWTRNRLTSVTTQTLQADGGYQPVDIWSLTHHWGTADTDYQLLLDSVQHTGKADGSVTLPKVTFGYDQLANRLDKVGDGRAPFIKQRLGTVDDESGGQIDINYKAPDCSWSDLPTPEANTTRCFPQYYQPSSKVDPKLEWFNKYVVEAVIQTDRTGGAPDMKTTYDYLGGGAWHFDDDDGLTKEKLKTWSQWRGFSHVRQRTGGVSAMSTQTDHYFLRGMDGDRKNASGATRSVTVNDGEGTSLTDHDALAGFEYRTETYSAPGGVVLVKSVASPWHHETAKRERSWGTTTANLTGIGTVRTYTSLDNGAGASWRRTQRTTSYENTAGRAVQVEDLGDLSTIADDRCTTTSYIDNTTDWLLAFPSRTETVTVDCSARPVRRTQADGTGSQVLSDIRTGYDNQSWGAAPVKGDATMAQTLVSHDGRYGTYQNARTAFDDYGRPTESWDIYSSTVYDDTGADAPSTTAASDARKTTTAYTPATGRPTRITVTTPPAATTAASTAQTTTTYYDTLRGATSATVDANGKRTDLMYDALGRLVKVWLPNRPKASSPTPSYEYVYTIADDTIVSVETKVLRNNGTQQSSFALYDGLLRQRQTQEPGPDGGRLLTDTFYDARGLTVLTWTPYYVTGAPSGTLQRIDDDSGVETQTAYQYDGLGRQTSERLLAGNGNGEPLATTTVTYGGDRVSVVPPTGGTPTTTVLDAQGRTIELRQYHGPTATGAYDATHYEYNAVGFPTRLADPAGNVWTWAYDLRGNQVKAVDPDHGTTVSGYDKRGRLISTAAGEQKLFYAYDDLDRRTAERSGSATGLLMASWTYDAAGYKGQLASSSRFRQVGSATYEYKDTVNFYDELYRVTRSTTQIPSVPGEEALAGSYQVNSPYNLDGTPKTIGYPAAGGLPAEALAPTYDDLHRVTALEGATSYLTKATYSLTGKPLQYELSTGGRKAWITDSYEWGTQRLATSRTDLENTTGPERAALYHYDQAGNVLSVSDRSRTGTDTQCFGYDYLQRLTQSWSQSTDSCAAQPSAAVVDGPAPYWTSYTYNLDGSRKTETQHDAGGNSALDTERAYHYPTAGSPHPHALSGITTTGPDARTESFDYDTTGNTIEHDTVLSDTRLPAGTVLTGGQDATSPSARLVMQTDGNLVLYAISSGEKLWQSGTAGHPGATATMRDDGALVVTGTDHAVLWTSGTATGAGSGNAAVLTAHGNLAVRDADGHDLWSTGTLADLPDGTPPDSTMKPEWDAEGRLAKVSQTTTRVVGGTSTSSTSTTTYLYDAAGNRLLQRTANSAAPGSATTTLYLGATELTFASGAASATATRYYDLGEATAVRTSDGTVNFLVGDQHGTDDVTVNAATGATSQRRSAPFGAPRGAQPATWPGTRGFVGGTVDPTGLTHLGAREYDPATGRFLSVDPLLDASNPQQLNGYAYAENSPVTRFDPSGQFSLSGLINAVLGFANNLTAAINRASQHTGSRPGSQGTGSSIPAATSTPASTSVSPTPSPSPGPPPVPPPYAFAPSPPSRVGLEIALAVCGWIPFAGVACDAYDLKRSWDEGDNLGVGLSIVGFLPFGDFAKIPKAAKRVDEARDAVKEAKRLHEAAEAEKAAQKALKACAGRSFLPDAPVLLADGTTKPIQDVKVGDRVWATDPDTGESTARPVTAVLRMEHDEDFADVTLQGADGTETLTATTNHPIWVDSTHTWTPAGSLVPGMRLHAAAARPLRVVQVHTYTKRQTTYDLTVADVHTFYVIAGATPVLVHNSGPNCGVPLGGKNGDHLGGEDFHGSEYSLDEITEFVNGHTGDGNPAMGRPSAAEVETTLRQAGPRQIEGQNSSRFDYDGVRVIVNWDMPWKSTAYYPGR
ncbi:RHS repeat-associated core domain-containing protein [Streptomyces sp. NPDC092296]|uniref:RHS repeat-associated core domain-containing protein n=1 Tax=Streptomyces sp. NPDC092296 TaxID=3366012 RepID=UPI00380D5519